MKPRQFLTIWDPPVLRAPRLDDGSCQWTLTAEPNRPWQIQASPDLVHWETLATVTGANTRSEYAAPAPAEEAWRFSRLLGQ